MAYFPVRYFPIRYFTPRYFTDGGAPAPPQPVYTGTPSNMSLLSPTVAGPSSLKP